MSLDRVRTIFSAAGVRLTVSELAEAIWLAGQVDLSVLGAAPGGPGASDPATAEPGPSAGGKASAELVDADQQHRSRIEELPTEMLELYLPAPDRAPRDDQNRVDEQSGKGGASEGAAGTGTVGAGADGDETAGHGPVGIEERHGGESSDSLGTISGWPLRVRAVSALPDSLDVLRALRPLRRRVPSTHRRRIDEEATARQFVERRLWIPVWQPVPDRWLDLILVLDQSAVGGVWGRLGYETRSLLEQLGAFRTIRVRYLRTGPDGALAIAAAAGVGSSQPHSPLALAPSSGDKLVLVVSDCVSAAWHDGTMAGVLWHWAQNAAVAILQPLPEHLWHRTGLALPARGRLRASRPGVPSVAYSFTPRGRRKLPPDSVPIPILELDAGWLLRWAKLIAGRAIHGINAVVAVAGEPGAHRRPDQGNEAGVDTVPAPVGRSGPEDHPSALRLVRWFRADATERAYQLARHLAAAVPLNLGVMRVIQEVMLPGSRLSHLAEVMFSGLLTPVPGSNLTGDDQQYDFVPGVRDVLLGTLRVDEAQRVYDGVSEYLEWRLEQPGAPFSAVVSAPIGSLAVPALRPPFAQVRTRVLRRLSGHPAFGRPLIADTGQAPARQALTRHTGTGQAGATRDTGVPAVGRATILHLAGPKQMTRLAAANGPGDDPERVGDPEQMCADLLARLSAAQTQGMGGPDVIVVTGDLASHARPVDYHPAYDFLECLRDRLGLPAGRVIVVPGLGDGFPGKTFDPRRPWYLMEIPQLRMVLAGLNSTTAASQQERSRYGWLGEPQLTWFADQLPRYERRGWLRVGVLRHDPTAIERDGARDPGGFALRDTDDFAELVVPHLDLVIHGRVGGVREIAVTGVPAIGLAEPSSVDASIGSVQLISVQPGTLRVRTVDGDGPRSAVTGEATVHQYGDHWWPRDDPGEDSDAAEAASPEPPGGDSPSDLDAAGTVVDVGGEGESRTDLVGRVAQVYRIRRPDAAVAIRHWPTRGEQPPTRPVRGYLLVGAASEPYRGVPTCVGVYDGVPTQDVVTDFLRDVVRPLPGGSERDTTLVSATAPTDPGLREWATGRGVRLVPFAEFQLGEALARYLSWQATRLANDPAFLPEMYVQQRYYYLGSGSGSAPAGEPLPDLLDQLRRWLSEPESQVIGVLGASGLGKTFLLRELARQLYDDHDPVLPMLVNLRGMDGSFGLNELITVQLQRGGEHTFDLAMIRYLLQEGRVALLCDGLDDLATRIGTSRVRRHWNVIRQAATGCRKIVLTCRDPDLLAEVLGQFPAVDPAVASATNLVDTAGRADPGAGDALFPAMSGRHRLVELAEFNREQILESLTRRLGGTAAARVRLELLEQVGGLLSMSENPRMLAFVAGIGDEQLRLAASGGGPITAARLYQRLVTQWLEQERPRLAGQEEAVPVDQLLRVVTSFALQLWETGESALSADALGAAADLLTRLTGVEPGRQRPTRLAAARLLGANTLLVRDRRYRFTFVDHSVLEWLVARAVAEQLLAGRGSETLYDPLRRAVSPLMTDFICDLAGVDVVRDWAESVATSPGVSAAIRANARRILLHLSRRT